MRTPNAGSVSAISTIFFGLLAALSSYLNLPNRANTNTHQSASPPQPSLHTVAEGSSNWATATAANATGVLPEWNSPSTDIENPIDEYFSQDFSMHTCKLEIFVTN